MITPMDRAAAMTCPTCGGRVIYKNLSNVYYGTTIGRAYACEHFPQCDTFVRALPDGRPTGTLADRKTRLARREAHTYFDRLWQDGQITRNEAYQYLARFMGCEVHIGSADVETCELIIGFAKTYLGECDHV